MYVALYTCPIIECRIDSDVRDCISIKELLFICNLQYNEFGCYIARYIHTLSMAVGAGLYEINDIHGLNSHLKIKCVHTYVAYEHYASRELPTSSERILVY